MIADVAGTKLTHVAPKTSRYFTTIFDVKDGNK